MKYLTYLGVLLFAAVAFQTRANPEIMKEAEAKAKAEGLDVKYSCNTCHDELPVKRNRYRLNLTEEGKRWVKKKPKPGCAVQ